MNSDSEPQTSLLDEETLEDISKEEMDQLEEIIDEYMEIVDNFDEDVDDILQRINDTGVYEKLGVNLHVDLEYQYYFEERDDN